MIGAASSGATRGSGEEAAAGADDRVDGRAVLLLVFLFLAIILSFLDRVILGLLIKPIRADLDLTDTQFSLLFGLVFAGPYVLATLFAGWMADRARRLTVLSLAVLLWSASTAMSMFATEFSHLALARIGVACGEAALLPCGYSLLADRFPTRLLGRVYSIMIMGANVGTGIALVFGGAVYDAIAGQPFYQLPLVGAVRPWQLAFLLVGAPGIVLAMLLGALPEPSRRHGKARADALPVLAALRGFARHWQAYLVIAIAFPLSAMSLQTVQIFGVQHLVRSFGMSLGEAGLRIGVPVALLGPCGLWLGGYLNDRWRAAGRADAAFLVGAVAAAGLATGTLCAMTLQTPIALQVALALVGFFSNFPFGAAASAMVGITPQRARGTITAIYTMFATVFGSGLAPVITALIADKIFRSEQSVGAAVAVVSVGSSLTAALLFLWGRGHLRRAFAEAA